MFVSPRVRDRLRLKLRFAQRQLRRRAVERERAQLRAEKLRSSPLLSHWPATALSDLFQSMAWEVYLKDEAIVYGGEPIRFSSLFWVLSGKLTEVQGKKCVYVTGLNDTPPAQSTTEIVESKSSPRSAFGTSTLDDMASFRHGGFLAGERLFLGVCYRRTIRCATAVTVLRVPFRMLQQVQRRWNISPKASISAAKEILREQMLHEDDKPLLQHAQQLNPLLQGLDATSLGILWMHLSPEVFYKGECICEDVFSSQHVYFLHTGSVSLRDTSEKHETKRVVYRGCAVGLESFAPFGVPEVCGARRLAVASTFSQLWSIPVAFFMENIGQSEWKKCVEIAKKTTPSGISCKMLRSVPLFSQFPEWAVVLLSELMRCRIVHRNECILASSKIPHEAVLVVAGAACCARKAPALKSRGVAKTISKTSVLSGDVIALEECAVQRALDYDLLAETGAVVFLIPRDAIAKLMKGDKSGWSLKPSVKTTDNQLRDACATSDGQHSAHEVQLAPLHSVGDRAEKLMDEERLVDGKGLGSSPDTATDQLVALHTNILSTLCVMIENLRPGASRPNQENSPCNVASGLVVRRLHCNESQKHRCPKSCFTLDDDGRVVFSNDGVVQTTTRPNSSVSPRNAGLAQKVQGEGAGASEGVGAEVPTFPVKIEKRPARSQKRIPPNSSLRCALSGRLAPLTGGVPVSHKAMALRRQGNKLQDEVEKAFSLPLDLFSLPLRCSRSSYTPF